MFDFFLYKNHNKWYNYTNYYEVDKMQKQVSLSDIEFKNKRKKTRNEIFLEEMNAITPWSVLLEVIRPFYHKGERGRPPIDLETILRMYMVSVWFTLADERTEDMVYENSAIRSFVGINLSYENVPDATTLLNFRHLLEEHNLNEAIFKKTNELLEEKNLVLKKGTIVDATILPASSSTKNKVKARDSEMKSTKKGNNYAFGMKAHIGVDDVDGVVHTVVSTAANIADIAVGRQLLHGSEDRFGGDSGYIGSEKRPEFQDMPELQYSIVKRPSQMRKYKDTQEGKELFEIERKKCSLRAKVEHPFRIIKNIFGFKKVKYKGLNKNNNRLLILFASHNFYILRKRGLSLCAD